MKSSGTAYALWFFLGFLGIHKFYLSKPFMGIICALTFGLFGFGWFIDLFTIPTQVRSANWKLAQERGAMNGLAGNQQQSVTIVNHVHHAAPAPVAPPAP